MADDFKNAQFTRSLGGYSTVDVDNYIDYMSGEYLKLEQHCKDSDRKLLFALRKLEALTIELQNNYSAAEGPVPASVSVERSSSRVELNSAQLTGKELESAKEELEKVRREAAALKKESETKAVELIRAANAKSAEIIKEAEEAKADSAKIVRSANEKSEKLIADAKLKADEIVAGSAQRARDVAEQILTNAAVNSRKIIKEAKAKANDACREVVEIYKAAEEMYSEVSSFRGSLFSLYSSHIESIESIAGSAHVLVDSVDGIARRLEAAKEPDEPTAEPEIDETGSEMKTDGEEIKSAADSGIPDAGEEETDEGYSFTAEPTVSDTIDEYYDSYDELPEDDEEDEAVPEHETDTDEVRHEEETEEYSDDFELPDDVSGGTNVLDIVKNISAQPSDISGDDMSEMEELFSGELGVSAEEFSRVFPSRDILQSIDEIRSQPTVAPETPENPKKHSKF